MLGLVATPQAPQVIVQAPSEAGWLNQLFDFAQTYPWPTVIIIAMILFMFGDQIMRRLK